MSKAVCAFCDAKMGAKAKLAFDPARRLMWRICARCGQWNLADLDVEELEMRFRAAAQGGGLAEIGVALVDGVTMVRVGDVSWREFAAWRYGRRLSARLIKARLWNLGYAILVVALFYTPPGKWLTAFPAAMMAFAAFQLWDLRRMKERVVWRMREGVVRIRQAWRAEISGDRLVVEHSKGVAVLRGEEAIRALAV